MLSRVIFVLLTLATLASAQRHKPYVDQEAGFSIRPPSGFSRVPMRGGEKWILAKFLSDKSFPHIHEQEGKRSTIQHRPTMRVLVFPKDVKAVKVERVKKKKKDGSTIDGTVITISNPYKNYKDYLQRHDQGGGWHISQVTETIIAGVPATWTEAEIRSMTILPRDLMAVVYHLEDRTLVVEVDVLPEFRSRMNNRMKNSLKSLRWLGTTLPKAKGSPNKEKFDIATDTELSHAERSAKLAEHYAKVARKRREEDLKRAVKNKPKGWRAMKRKNFVVLTHVGDKYTNHILKQSGYFRKWLDKKFAKIGDGKVYPSLIRIFKGRSEAQAYLRGSGDSYFYDTGEVVCGGEASAILSDFSSTSTGLLEQYLTEKNPALWGALPDWLRGGLTSYASTAFPSKAKGLVFVSPRSLFTEGKKLCEEGTFPTIRSLMRSEWSSMVSREERSQHTILATLFVRYLMEKGKKGKTKNLLRHWMDMSLEVLNKMDGDFWQKITKDRKTTRPLTEEEEDKAFKERKKRSREFHKAFVEDRKKLLRQAFDETFKGWSERDWKKLDKSFRSWVKAGGR